MNLTLATAIFARDETPADRCDTAALANGVVQINLLVGQLVSSQQVSAISWLYGADRLYQLPLGVVGIAVGIVLLPELSGT